MKTICQLTAIATLLAGCIAEEGFEDPDFDAQLDAASEMSEVDGLAAQPGAAPEAAPTSSLPYPSSTASCPNARVIGVLNPGLEDCSLAGALPGGWNPVSMFDAGSQDILDLGVVAPPELRRFCLYEPEAPAVNLQDYIDLFDDMHATGMIDVAHVAPDCMGQSVQGTDLYATPVLEGLEESFHLNVDRVVDTDLGATSFFRDPVDVAVIDTTSQGAADGLYVPASEHGNQIAAIIGDLACPKGLGSCLDDIRHFLAMPRNDWASPPNWNQGGMQGTQGDLAMAIYAAVRDWRERLGGPDASERLVLNLSLGWQRDLDDSVDPSRAPMMALEMAMKYASCSGALMFVAAGNVPEPGCEAELNASGWTEPAGFETYPAPTAAECASLGFALSRPGRPNHGAGYKPLVYAVGGVDGHDAPLANSRDGGQPRLVAAGQNGVSSTPVEHTSLTGTSVSAAVASATAALLWQYRPELAPSESAELIHASGYATGDTADFGLGTPGAVRRVSVGAALGSACLGESPITCPGLSTTAPAPATDANLGTFFTEVDAIHGDVVAAGTLVNLPASDAPTGVTASCDVSDWTSLTDPQPEVPICSHCSIDVPKGGTSNDDTLMLEVHADYKGYIQSATLVTYDASRNATRFDLADIVSDLNDTGTDLVTVELDAPGTVSAVLQVEEDSSGRALEQSNAITVRSR